jgi:hypothetical protein
MDEYTHSQWGAVAVFLVPDWGDGAGPYRPEEHSLAAGWYDNPTPPAPYPSQGLRIGPQDAGTVVGGAAMAPVYRPGFAATGSSSVGTSQTS